MKSIPSFATKSSTAPRTALGCSVPSSQIPQFSFSPSLSIYTKRYICIKYFDSGEILQTENNKLNSAEKTIDSFLTHRILCINEIVSGQNTTWSNFGPIAVNIISYSTVIMPCIQINKVKMIIFHFLCRIS